MVTSLLFCGKAIAFGGYKPSVCFAEGGFISSESNFIRRSIKKGGEDYMVKINGEALAVAGKTLAEYLETTSYHPTRIAVERNGEIVPKAAYGETIL